MNLNDYTSDENSLACGIYNKCAFWVTQMYKQTCLDTLLHLQQTTTTTTKKRQKTYSSIYRSFFAVKKERK